MSDTRSRTVMKRLTGPDGRSMHALTRSFSTTPRQLYVYRNGDDPWIVVSNHPMGERAEPQLVGIYDKTVTSAMLRTDLYGIEEEQYRSTIKWGPGRPPMDAVGVRQTRHRAMLRRRART